MSSPEKSNGVTKKASPKKKGKKKNPWSDESEMSAADSDHSDVDLDTSITERNKAPPRRAAGEYNV